MNQHLDRLDGLAPFLRQPALKLIELCDLKLQRKLMIVSGWRSVQDQMLLYQQGRAINRETGEWDIVEPSKVVTRAKPGTTAHNIITRAGGRASLAMDVIPLLPDGSAEWNVGIEFWDKLYELAWKCGLDPLGDQIGEFLQNDRGHFQEPGYRWKMDGLGLIFPSNTITSTA